MLNNLPIQYEKEPLSITFGDSMFSHGLEMRRIGDIKKSLQEEIISSPEELYLIAMGVGEKKHQERLDELNLLYGFVVYANGKINDGPIRSQGHVHAVSSSCGYSTPEVYEIWSGKAYIYMQEYVEDKPGRCFAIEADPGDVVIVPPNWAHATISANPREGLAFGAWCVKDFGFEYTEIRKRNGLAWIPHFENDELKWTKNEHYHPTELIIKKPRKYTELLIDDKVNIYQQFVMDNNHFTFVTQPQLFTDIWEKFIP